MKKELSYYLVQRYHSYLREAKTTDMDWSWGFECDDGWFHLLNNMFKCIDNHIQSIISYNKRASDENKKHVPYVKIVQIKEKFGTLRVYFDTDDTTDYLHGIIRTTEQQSTTTCEVCGNLGQLRSGGWIRTLCDTHNQQRNNYIEEQQKLQNNNQVNAVALFNGKLHHFAVVQHLEENKLIGLMISDPNETNMLNTNTENTLYTLEKVETPIFSYITATPIPAK